jgi:hypothetical protein
MVRTKPETPEKEDQWDVKYRGESSERNSMASKTSCHGICTKFIIKHFSMCSARVGVPPSTESGVYRCPVVRSLRREVEGWTEYWERRLGIAVSEPVLGQEEHELLTRTANTPPPWEKWASSNGHTPVDC